ncbi:MAG: DUF2493 domain-containing protein [Bacteroidales bacterium]|nr:DUF2493 domain-containing protein [Bacteroidales bacterium]
MKKLIRSNNIRARIIICGGRHFDNYECLEDLMDDVLTDLDLDFSDIEIISGGCSGADKLGELYADRHNTSCTVFPTQWETYGRAAGPIRNSEMIKYAAASEIPVVVAFISDKTVGTNDTVNKAKKQGFTVYSANYSVVEASVSVFGGIRPSETDEYIFDFDKDDDGDIVKLSKQCINVTKTNGNIRYYGYRVEQDIESAIRKAFLSWIKTPDGYSTPGVAEMIDRCVEEFVENNSAKYDFIIPVASTSELTTILADKLSVAFGGVPIVSTNKLLVAGLSLDTAKARAELIRQGKSEDYITNLLQYIQTRYIDPQLAAGNFAMHKISPKYRKWITPMFTIPDIYKVASANRILIVDETITTGESINQIITILRSAGYNHDVDIFTLLSNR